MTLVVLDAAGLSARMLEFMPRLRGLAADGFKARLDPVLPALTAPMQSTLLTGLGPSEHGVVANGWYSRKLGEILMRRPHSALVEAERVWDAARRVNAGLRAASLCWTHAAGASTDFTVVPRPVHRADGSRSAECYAYPPELHARLQSRLGPFPLSSFWGPRAGIGSSLWIADAARLLLNSESPNLLFAYLPHVDYDLQRFGPEGPEAAAAARELDEVAGGLVEYARARGDKVVLLSEYGITPARRPIDINRALRRAGLLHAYEQAGMEYLDVWTSRAFAVADHQIAHVYISDPRDSALTHEVLSDLDGVTELLDGEAKTSAGLDHPRSGDLVAVADPDAWFTYYYWLDDERAPDFARAVAADRKPGSDPAELLADPDDRWAAWRAARARLRKRLGMRHVTDVVPLNPRHVRGTYGRLPATADDAPLLICSEPGASRDRIAATEVRDLLLELQGLSVQGRMALA
jgi:predicted AlkP superfamily pyrophosphatase or phosphodiesterase